MIPIRLEGEHPCGAPRFYEPHPDDHEALVRRCPACAAPIGAWCGGAGDVHDERKAPVPEMPARGWVRRLLDRIITG